MMPHADRQVFKATGTTSRSTAATAVVLTEAQVIGVRTGLYGRIRCRSRCLLVFHTRAQHWTPVFDMLAYLYTYSAMSGMHVHVMDHARMYM